MKHFLPRISFFEREITRVAAASSEREREGEGERGRQREGIGTRDCKKTRGGLICDVPPSVYKRCDAK